MKNTFTRALVINAALQFVITRQRAGNVIEEGAAEALWMRYPFVVLLNALMWTLMVAAFRRVTNLVRMR
jgi:hypothetical protein